MKTMTTRACLFGGALVAVGMTSAASAQFSVLATTHNAGFSDGPYVAGYAGGGDYTTVTDTGAATGFTYAYVGFATGNSAGVYLTSSQLSGTVIKEINGFGYFAFRTEFQLAASADISIEWDIPSTVSTADREFRIFEFASSPLFVYDEANGPHAGTASLSLDGGVIYTIDALIRTTFANAGGFISISVADEACAADLDGDNDADLDDILAFFSLFGGASSTDADRDNDGDEDLDDILSYFADFSEGC